jgi:hypothetical protein
MMRLRTHPAVLTRALHEQTGYDEAEDLIRGEARRGDSAAKKSVAEIDAAEAKMKTDASALNADMAKRLAMSAAQAAELVRRLEADPDLERWLLRRVNLTRALGRELSADEHHFNSED